MDKRVKQVKEDVMKLGKKMEERKDEKMIKKGKIREKCR